MRRYLFILILLLCCSCGTEYYDVDTEEVTPPEGIEHIIPQQGTLLSLDVTYKFDFYTRFQPGRDYRVYRYRVLIDGWEYSTGAVNSEPPKVSIPIMANDTHVPVSVVVEGAKAMDYSDYPKSWDTWHELYRGTQVGLTDAESPEFSGLGGSRLLLETNGKTIRFDIEESGSGIAFKRLMSGLGRVAIPVTIDSFIDFWEFPEPIAQTVPVNQDTSGSDWKAGNLYLDGGRLCISLRDTKNRYCYPTLLGRVVKEDLESLKSLYPGRQRQEQAEIAMCLE